MSNPDHFALFALPARFALDEAALERAHKDVQAKVHPDRFAAGSAAERRVAMQWAARANEAYRTLKAPVARAAYLCERAGTPVATQSNTGMPAEFLAQQMEWREELEAARLEGDAALLAELMQRFSGEHDRLVAELADAIDARGDFTEAAGIVRRLMFIEKIREEAFAAADAAAPPHQAPA